MNGVGGKKKKKLEQINLQKQFSKGGKGNILGM